MSTEVGGWEYRKDTSLEVEAIAEEREEVESEREFAVEVVRVVVRDTKGVEREIRDV